METQKYPVAGEKMGTVPVFQNGEAEYLAVYQQLNGIIDAISKSIKKRRKTEAV